MVEKAVGIFGNFGWGNLGNSATLEATLDGVRRFAPQSPVICICSNPEEVQAQYHLDVAAIRWTRAEIGDSGRGEGGGIGSNAARRLQKEAQFWQRAHDVVRQLDMLLVAGTGILDDFAIGPLDLPYDLFKWAQLAALNHVPMVFLSVGAGPIDHRLSRILLRFALNHAQYRSFRDHYSLNYVRQVGMGHANDCVQPDLAFGLPVLERWQRPNEAAITTIGLGLMTYSGSHLPAVKAEGVYQAYLQHITSFAKRVLARGFRVRLLLGDTQVDQMVWDDVVAQLAPLARPGMLVAEPTATVTALLDQIAQTDVVVATRFHNLLLGLLLGRPALSISYNQKNDDLMRAFGMGEFCQTIDTLDVDRLDEQLATLIAREPHLRLQISQQVKVYRQRLDEQYAHVFAQV